MFLLLEVEGVIGRKILQKVNYLLVPLLVLNLSSGPGQQGVGDRLAKDAWVPQPELPLVHLPQALIVGGVPACGEFEEGHVHLENLGGVEVVVLEVSQQVGLALVCVFAEYALQIYFLLFLPHECVQGFLLLLPQLFQSLGLLFLQHLHLPLLNTAPVHYRLQVDL